MPSCYRFAGCTVATNQALPRLGRYHWAAQAASVQMPVDVTPLPSGETVRCRGWLAGARRNVVLRSASAGYWIEIEGIGRYHINNPGTFVLQEVDPTCRAHTQVEAFLGPPLLLALALRGVFCLHASGVMGTDGVTAVAGESGTGKSTLAAYLHTQGIARRAADDLLPVTLSPDGLLALPRIPQLKLPLDQQPGSTVPEHVSVTAVHILYLSQSTTSIAATPLPQTAAALALAQHTVGTRFFPPPLLARHLAFAARAAEVTAVRRLTYAHHRDALSSAATLVGQSTSP